MNLPPELSDTVLGQNAGQIHFPGQDVSTNTQRGDTIPSLTSIAAKSLIDSGITTSQMEINGYPRQITNIVNKELVNKALFIVIQLANDEHLWADAKPVRLTIQDVNPREDAFLGRDYQPEGDTVSFYGRWNDWKQRRLKTRQAFIDQINDKVQRMLRDSPWVTLFPLFIQLATFEFAEQEPNRLTLEDTTSSWPVYELDGDAATFPQRWQFWNQRRLKTRRAIIDQMHDRVQQLLGDSPWITFLPLFIQLATFEFVEAEPNRLPIWSVQYDEEDEATFPDRLQAWKQRRSDTRQAILDQLKLELDSYNLQTLT